MNGMRQLLTRIISERISSRMSGTPKKDEKNYMSHAMGDLGFVRCSLRRNMSQNPDDAPDISTGMGGGPSGNSVA